MKQYLIKAYENQYIISIYTNMDDVEHFAAGIIVGISDDYVIFNSISPNGNEDGLYLVDIKNIFRISCDGLYEKKLKKLWDINKQTIKYSFKNNLMYELLSYSKEKKYVISVELCDSKTFQITGLLLNFNDDEIVINSFNDYGENNGENVIYISHISKLSVNSSFERNINELINLQK